jgi:hypothetical protein
LYWNIRASDITEQGRYDLRLTPVEPDQTTSSQDELTAIGPSIIQTVEVSPALIQAQEIDLRVFPPEKIITPGMASYNDQLDILFKKDEELRSEFYIFTLSGALVYQIEEEPERLSGNWYKYSWGGQDTGDRLCPSGLYIYLLQMGAETTKGTCVVAR